MTDRLRGECFSKLDDGYGRAPDDLGLRGLAANIEPCLDLGEIPHDAAGRQIITLRKLASLFHVVDGRIGRRRYFPEMMTLDVASYESFDPVII